MHPFLVQIHLIYEMNNASDGTKFILDSSINFVWTGDGKQLRVSYFKNNGRVLTLQTFFLY